MHGALHIHPRADPRDSLCVARAGPAEWSCTAGSARSSSSGTPATPNRRSASLRTTSSRPPSPERRQKRSTSRPARLGRLSRALAYEEAARHFDRALRPWSFPRTRRIDPLQPVARPRRGPQQGERVRSEPRRLPIRRGARADGRARGAPRPCGAWPRRGWIEQGTPTPRSSRCSRRRSPRCPTTERRSAPGCSAASPWSCTSPTSPSAARRWRDRAPGCPAARRPVDACVRAQRPPLGPARPRRSRRAARASLTRSSATPNHPRSSSWPSKATAGASSTSSTRTDGGDRRRDLRLREARRSPGPTVLSILGRGAHPVRALMQGRFDDAERLATEALAAAESAGNWNGITSSRVQLAWCWKDVGGRRRTGRRSRAVRAARSAHPVAVSRRGRDLERQPRAVHGRAGLEERAGEYLGRIADCGNAELTRNVDGRSAAALAAEACGLLGMNG